MAIVSERAHAMENENAHTNPVGGAAGPVRGDTARADRGNRHILEESVPMLISTPDFVSITGRSISV